MNVIQAVAVAFVTIIVIATIMVLPTMFLWNYLMPDLFNLPTIGFLQAWGINILSGILFRSGDSSND